MFTFQLQLTEVLSKKFKKFCTRSNNLLTTVQNVPSTRSKDTFLSHCVSLLHSYDAQSHVVGLVLDFIVLGTITQSKFFYTSSKFQCEKKNVTARLSTKDHFEIKHADLVEQDCSKKTNKLQ